MWYGCVVNRSESVSAIDWSANMCDAIYKSMRGAVDKIVCDVGVRLIKCVFYECAFDRSVRVGVTQ